MFNPAKLGVGIKEPKKGGEGEKRKPPWRMKKEGVNVNGQLDLVHHRFPNPNVSGRGYTQRYNRVSRGARGQDAGVSNPPRGNGRWAGAGIGSTGSGRPPKQVERGGYLGNLHRPIGFTRGTRGRGVSNGGNRGPQRSTAETDGKSIPAPDQTRKKGERNRRKVFVLQLDALLSMGPMQVIGGIHINLEEWKELVQDESPAFDLKQKPKNCKFEDDDIVKILQVIGGVLCDDSVLGTMQREILTATIQCSNFTTKIQSKFGQLQAEFLKSSKMELPEKFFRDLLKVCNFVMSTMKSSDIDFINSVLPAALATLCFINEGAGSSTSNMVSGLRKEFTAIKISKDRIEVDVQRKRMEQIKVYGREFLVRDEDAHLLDAPEDFRLLPVVPTIEELLSEDDSYLRTNKVTGAYRDVEHYLDVQFRLLREDFIRPLKTGIQDYLKRRAESGMSNKKQPRLDNVRVYENVQLKNVDSGRGGQWVQLVKLDERDRKGVRWEQSKRLLNGSLLVFTSDNFKSTYFATVYKREDRELNGRGEFVIEWDRDSIMKSFPKNGRSFLMVESEVFFEAYRHTLATLKHIRLGDFTLSKFILFASPDVGPPKYLATGQAQMKVQGKMINPLVLETWPTAAELKMDSKQYDAFRACMTKEFVIVQGPPGTGKTYLGLQVVKTLLQNRHLWKSGGGNKGGPILIVCYTNHALDQFLEGIAKLFKEQRENPKVIRVGGMSKSETMKKFSLREVRDRHKHAQRRHLSHEDEGYREMRKNATEAMIKAEQEFNRAHTEVNELCHPTDIVDFKSLLCKSELLKHFSLDLLKRFDSPTWFGYDPFIFLNNRNALSHVRGMWNLRKPTAPLHQSWTVVEDYEQVEEDSDDDAENRDAYNLDELLKERMLEDTRERAVLPPKHKSSFQVTFLHRRHAEELRESIKRTEYEFHQTKEFEPDDVEYAAYLEMTLAQLEAELTAWISFVDFTKEVLNQFKNGFIPEDPRAIKMLQTFDPNLGFIFPLVAKWSVYLTVLNYAKDLAKTCKADAHAKLQRAQSKLDEVLKQGDVQLLRDALIIGMTTTGAAKNNDLLRAAKPRIVIVEEAAEVLESHIVTCLTQSCEQLILIGDHQQLRPSVTVYELSTQYNLDISLFERLVKNNLHCYTIDVQHRMRPIIANLVVGTIYKTLHNALSVSKYPRVLGTVQDLYFIDHEEPELSAAGCESRSKSNKFEAKFIVELCLYFLAQGYSPQQITILTTYLGQMFLIKQVMQSTGRDPDHGVRITCVDNYQGEESDIILLSLVRSNKAGSIGFLKTDNRICVALSRAKHGMFVIGNMALLARKSQTWGKIQEKLQDSNIGRTFQLMCQVHGTLSDVSDPSDFQRFAPDGGCLLPCNAQLQCGHVCRLRCHIEDKQHSKYKCFLPCKKICERQHPCPQSCHELCSPCLVNMLKQMPCGHEQLVTCHRYETETFCTTYVEKQLPCGHLATIYCSTDPDQHDCQKKIIRKLPCDHDLGTVCFRRDEPAKCKILMEKLLPCTHKAVMQCSDDLEEYKCPELVTHLLECGHKKVYPCHVDISTKLCVVKVEKLLKCGHTNVLKCSDDISTVQCLTPVDVSFKSCSHKTIVECCNAASAKCGERCTYNLKTCDHKCMRICHGEFDSHVDYPCKELCTRSCADGHPCREAHFCHAPCPPCKTVVTMTLDCGHEKNSPCSERIQDGFLCRRSCAKKQDCGHYCKKTCSEPCGPCKVFVDKVGNCGHVNQTECGKPFSSDACYQLIVSKVKSPCGHEVEIPCNKAHEVTPGYLLTICKQPCNHVFSLQNGDCCAHKCKGSCSACGQGRSHVICPDTCSRKLLCGHQCQSCCSKPCPPCAKQCMLYCEHSTCQAQCGQPCTGCAEPCGWRCEHQQCGQFCSSLCDRDPCNLPCPVTLSCGHPCIGFCGEPCPPLCRACNAQELQELANCSAQELCDMRFVLLEDCHHVVDFPSLDEHMNSSNGRVVAKLCPKCQVIICKSRRYGNAIKMQSINIGNVKRETASLNIQVQKEIPVLLQRLNAIRCPQELLAVKAFCKKKLSFKYKKRNTVDKPTNESRQPKQVDPLLIMSIDLIISYWEETNHHLKMTSPLEKLRSSYTELISAAVLIFEKIMKTQLPFTVSECSRFEQDFQKIHDIARLHRLLVSQTLPTGATALLKIQAKAIISDSQPYDSKQMAAFDSIISRFSKRYSINDNTHRKRPQVLGVYNLPGTLWYICVNGHANFSSVFEDQKVQNDCLKCAIPSSEDISLKDCPGTKVECATLDVGAAESPKPLSRLTSLFKKLQVT